MAWKSKSINVAPADPHRFLSTTQSGRLASPLIEFRIALYGFGPLLRKKIANQIETPSHEGIFLSGAKIPSVRKV